jgi:hypothetical protein
MNASSDLQSAISSALEGAPGITGANVPVLKRRPKELQSDIEAAVADFGICIFVLPPLPTHFLQGAEFIFFDRAEARVRIIEYPTMNTTGKDVYELLDAIALALHWTNPGNMLAHPLQLASHPCEMVEDKDKRILDVIFEAVYQINKS